MNQTTFNFRVDESLKHQFTTAAKAVDRSGAQLLRDFMRDFIQRRQEATEYDVWFRRQVQMGLDEANAGKTIPGEEVEAEAVAWRDEIRRKLASSAS